MENSKLIGYELISASEGSKIWNSRDGLLGFYAETLEQSYCPSRC
jgi:hypothetical protein